MGWWQRVRNAVSRRRDPAQLIRWIPYVPESGLRLTFDEALSLSAVWACMDAIAKSIASCQVNVFLPKGEGKRDLLEDDPVMWLLNTRPNPEMTAIALKEAMLYTAIPNGNAYAEIVPDNSGRVSQLWPMEYERTTPRRAVEEIPGIAAAGELFYEYRQQDGGLAYLPARRVFHLRGPSLSGFLGENVLARAARSLSSAAAAERFSTAFFGQGAHPGGFLKHPEALSQDAKERIEADLMANRAGPRNAFKPMVLEEGMEWIQATVDPGKSQLVESRQFSVEEICRWFGVPPHKVQHLLRSTYSNIEHQSIEFVRDALSPWCRRFEQEADFKLFRRDRGPWRKVEIDTSPLTYGDALSRAQADAVWRQNGIKTANEIRRREGLNDAGPDGDVLLVQSNLTTVENILNPPEPKALPAGEPADGMDPAVPEEEDDDEAMMVARKALTILTSGALERYRRRLDNRRADLAKKHTPEEVAVMLNEERGRVLQAFSGELAQASEVSARALGRALGDADAWRALSAMESGAAPQAAAEAMISGAALN